MRFSVRPILTLAVLAVASGPCLGQSPAPAAAPAPASVDAAKAPSPDVQARRDALRRKADSNVKELAAGNPSARRTLEAAAGYAVFETTGVNVVLLVGAKGQGVAIDKRSGEQIFMTSLRAGTGPGVGATSARTTANSRRRKPPSAHGASTVRCPSRISHPNRLASCADPSLFRRMVPRRNARPDT